MAKVLGSGRLPHALLFRGPEGVGKQLFARRLAAVINCRNLAERPCGQCPSCKKYHSGNHPDFMVIEPEKGSIKIDRIRELCRTLTYPPYESQMRVILLEDVHTMRREAANALLKTLEEPPENNLLILTADASRQVLPTILSRCQTMPFYPLSFADTARILQTDEHTGPEEAVLLARLAEGSPGRAVLFREAGLLPLLEDLVVFLSDPSADEPVNTGKALEFAEKIAALKDELVSFLGLLKIWCRDLLLLADGQPQLAERGIILHKNQHQHRKDWSSVQIFAKLAALDRALHQLNRNCNRGLVCEVLIFNLLSSRTGHHD